MDIHINCVVFVLLVCLHPVTDDCILRFNGEERRR